jgi:hypothetical protein
LSKRTQFCQNGGRWDGSSRGNVTNEANDQASRVKSARTNPMSESPPAEGARTNPTGESPWWKARERTQRPCQGRSRRERSHQLFYAGRQFGANEATVGPERLFERACVRCVAGEPRWAVNEVFRQPVPRRGRVAGRRGKKPPAVADRPSFTARGLNCWPRRARRRPGA